MKYFILFLILSTGGLLQAAEPDYSLYNKLLKKYTKQSSKDNIKIMLVDYKGIKADNDFAKVFETLESFDVTRLSGKKEKMAYYINLYNIFAIKKVLSKYPVKSINDVSPTVWKDTAGRLQGKNISLDTLENAYIRPLGDARIHFAIVCASVSCPDLRREAYTAAKLSSQLHNQTVSFLKNPGKGLINTAPGVYSVSEIFSWFSKDFGDIYKFLLKYKVVAPNAQIKPDLKYNWNLNGK